MNSLTRRAFLGTVAAIPAAVFLRIDDGGAVVGAVNQSMRLADLQMGDMVMFAYNEWSGPVMVTGIAIDPARAQRRVTFGSVDRVICEVTASLSA